MTRAVATYLYCLVRAPRRPSLTRVPAGLPSAAPPRLVEAANGLWLVAADAPLARYGEAAIERGLRDLDWVSHCALAHEQVIGAFLRAEALLPMKLFTLFHDDARALADVRRRRRAIDRALARVAGCQEWGVRLQLDPARAPGGAGDRALRSAVQATSGAAYLRAKQQLRGEAGRRDKSAERELDDAFDRFADHARDAIARPPIAPNGQPVPLLLDAAFLVPAEEARRFRAEVAATKRALAPRGYTLALSGPWAPYHFAEGRR